MPRTNFGSGTPITSEFLNAVGYPKITGLALDGHLDLLTNANFQNTPGNVVYDFYADADQLKASVDVSGGLNVKVNGTRLLMPNGEVVIVPTTVVAVPNNQVTYIYLDELGVIRQSSTNPPAASRSARVTTGSGQITSIEDLRSKSLWLPNVAALAVFGGNSTQDIVTGNGDVVMGGVVNCRNFTVPTTSNVLIDRYLTIRASGKVTILGSIETRVEPVVFAGLGSFKVGHGTGASAVLIGTNSIDRLGRVVQDRQKPKAYNGSTFFQAEATTVAADRAIFWQVDTINPANVGLTGTGTDGGILTIHAADSLRIAATAEINCSAINTTGFSIANSAVAVSGHPTTGLGSPTHACQLSMIPPQPVAGTVVLQSSVRIDVEAGAQIRCNGANQVTGRTLGFTQAATYTNTAYYKVGGGGGGAIHFQAPVVVASPSATITSLAGSTPDTTGLLLDGIGSSGNGFRASTLTQAQPGVISTVLAAPVEF
jgi:hypothetical protein